MLKLLAAGGSGRNEYGLQLSLSREHHQIPHQPHLRQTRRSEPSGGRVGRHAARFAPNSTANSFGRLPTAPPRRLSPSVARSSSAPPAYTLPSISRRPAGRTPAATCSAEYDLRAVGREKDGGDDRSGEQRNVDCHVVDHDEIRAGLQGVTDTRFSNKVTKRHGR